MDELGLLMWKFSKKYHRRFRKRDVSNTAEILEQRLYLSAVDFVTQIVVDDSSGADRADAASQVVAADVDGDGDLDLLSASFTDDKIAWYENQLDIDGTFQVHTIATDADGARSVSTADVDGDGDLDVLSASFFDDTIAWYENTQGNGNQFTKHIIATDADGARSVSTGDLDGDGDIDVLSASFDDRIVWYENTDGTGTTFHAHEIDAASDQAFQVSTVDLDGDSDLDVLVASRRDDTFAWFENTQGDASEFLKHLVSSSSDGASSLDSVDVDGDGDLDLVGASAFDNTVAWFENTQGDASEFVAHTVSTSASGATSVVAHDIDGDGDLDFVSASYADDKIAWFENTAGDGSAFTEHRVSLQAAGAQSVVTADFDSDGDSDLASASLDDDKIAWYEQEQRIPVGKFDKVLPNPRNSSLGDATLRFSENVSGVDISDFKLFQDSTEVGLNGVPVQQVTPSLYTIDLSSVTTSAGNYEFRLIANGSGIIDVDGNAITQDDSVFWVTDTTAPTATIEDVTPDPRNTAVGELTIDFSEDVTGVDLADFQLTRDGNGVSLSGVTFNKINPMQYKLDLQSVTGDSGSYELTLVSQNAEILDLAGNVFTVDASETWTADTVAPTVDIEDVIPDPRNTSVATVNVVFSEDVFNVDLSDFELRRNDQLVDTSGVPFNKISDSLYTLDLTSVTATNGSYELRLVAAGSGIADALGNSLSGDEIDVWIGDFTAPTATVDEVTPDPRSDAVNFVTIRFSENVAGVDLADFTLSRDAVPVDLEGQSFEKISSEEYRVGLASVTAEVGNYVFGLNASGSGILDDAGNLLVDDAADDWVTDDTPPTAEIGKIGPDDIDDPLGEVQIQFTEDVTGVDITDFTFSQDGVAVDIGSVGFKKKTASQYSINLTSVTLEKGNYILNLNAKDSGISDLSGNLFSKDSAFDWTTLTQFVQLTSPTGETGDFTPTIYWTRLGNIKGYDLLGYSITKGREVLNEVMVGKTRLTVSRDLPEDSYQVFVRAQTSTGPTDWSKPIFFDIVDPEGVPNPPKILAPKGTTKDTTPEILWTDEKHAVSYDLLGYSITLGKEVLNRPSIGTNSFTPTNPLPADTYQIFVRSHGKTQTSQWSQPVVFTVDSVLPPPTILTPIGTTNDPTPLFSWTVIDDAASFELLVYSITRGQEALHITGITTTQYTPGQNMSVDRFQTFVRTINTVGTPGTWSKPKEFQVAMLDWGFQSEDSGDEEQETESVSSEEESTPKENESEFAQNRVFELFAIYSEEIPVT